MFDRGLMLTRKLLNHGFLVAQLMSLLRQIYSHYLDLLTVTEYLCHSMLCRNHYHVLSAFMTYHRICNTSITTYATSGAGTGYPLEHLTSCNVFSGVAQLLVFYIVLYRPLFVLLLLLLLLFFFLSAIVLSVLQNTPLASPIFFYNTVRKS